MHGGILMEAGRHSEAAQQFEKAMTMHEAEMRQSAGAKFSVQRLEADRVYHRLLQALNQFYLGQRADAAASFGVVSKHQTVNYDSANTSDFWRYYAKLDRLLKEPPSQ